MRLQSGKGIMMRAKLLSSIWIRAAAVVLLLGSSLVLISAEKPIWGPNDKAFYADPNLVNYVRPGLVVEITNAEITADFTIKAWVKFTDPAGVPLDLDGIETPGVISASLIAATIPAGKTQYTAYTVSSRGGAGSDSGGVWQKLAPGEYLYTFKTKAPTNMDRGATHTIGVYARRDLREFDLDRPSTDDVFTFVPNGSPVTVVRDIVTTATCNGCHNNLTLHGRRHSVELCILCHQPQTSADANFPVMVHKIHAGAELENGFELGGHEYSDVEFPADVRRCTVCHDPDSGATQADAWYTSPSRVVCGSCHDTVNFATGEGHGAGGPQFTDNLCKNCHFPEGEREFDLSIKGAHTVPTNSKALAGLVVDLVSVANTAPGQKPTVTFKVTDKAGNPLIASTLNRLQLSLIGPTSDYREANRFQENALQAQAAVDGTHMYTFAAAIPDDASGSWAIGVEGRQVVDLLAGTVDQVSGVRDAAMNDVLYFSVDGSAVEQRRTIVSLEKCNACHADLSLHGNNRKSTEYCVFCHNVDETDAVVRPADQMPAEAIDFRSMIHRIHSGAEQEREYIVYGFGGSLHDYSGVEFPGILQDCNACHVGDSQQLPLSRKAAQVTDPRGWLNPVGPASAACLACHSSIEAASHALVNTTTLLGESCSACHGPDREFSVNKSHAWVR